jgi:hypothetical protein
VYCIWDYKTGSARSYEGHVYHGGRHIQPALYAIAAEQILKDKLGGQPRVERAGYYFPTRRGEGQRLSQEADRSQLRGLLGNLFDILHSETFLATDGDNFCDNCDYAGACDPKRATARAKALVQDAGSSCLESWRRLKAYE